MNTVTPAVRPRARSLAIGLDTDALALGGVALVLVVLAAITWGTWGDIGRDTGYDFVAASRVAHGHLPYADFTYYYGPLAPFVLGLAAFIGGSSISTFAAVGLVVASGIVLLTYAVARTQIGPLGSALAAIGTAAVAFSPTNLSFVVPHTYSESLAIALALVFLLGLSAAANGRSSGALMAGVAAGLVSLTRPEFEAAVVIACVAWLAVRMRTSRAGRGEALRLLAPAVALPAVVYGAFLTSVSPHRLFLENLYPVATLHAGGSSILRSQAPLTLHSVVQVVGYLAAYAVGAAALVVSGRMLGNRRPATAIALVGAAACVVLAVAAFDPEAARGKLQWVFGGVPLAAAAAAIALAYRSAVRRRSLAARDQTLFALIVVLAVVAAKTYSGFYFLADHAQPAVYLAPFVFVAIARLHLVDLARTRTLLVTGTAWLAVLALVCAGLTVKDASARSATVSGPGGTINVSQAEAPLYRAAVGAILSGTRPGEPILVAPQLTELYTLTDRTDPLRQISLVPGALPTRADELQAIRTLQASGVKVAITDRHPFTEYGQTRFGASFDRALDGWIRRHFNHAALLRPGAGVNHALDVWVRRGT